MQKLLYLCAVTVILLGVTAGAFRVSAKENSDGDKAAIQALYNDFNDAFQKKDVNRIMAFYAPDVFVFDVVRRANMPRGTHTRRTGRICLCNFLDRSPTLSPS